MKKYADYIDLGKLFDMIQSRASRLILTGFGVRSMIGIMALLVGIIYFYFCFIFNTVTLPSTYLYQQEIMPLAVYAILFSFLGTATLVTNNEKYRLSPLGRNIAVFGMALFLLFSLTFIATTAISALATYPVITYAYFCEAFTDT